MIDKPSKPKYIDHNLLNLNDDDFKINDITINDITFNDDIDINIDDVNIDLTNIDITLDELEDTTLTF